MSFQIVYISPELSKEYGATVNNVAGVLFVLSDKGSKGIQVTEAFLAERVCLSERMVRKAKALLRDNGYITVTIKQEGFKRSAVIECTKKLVQAFDFPIRNDVPDELGTACLTDTAQYAASLGTVCRLDRHSVPVGQAQCAGINKYINKYIKQSMSEDAAQCAVSHDEPTDFEIPEEFKGYFDIPLPDDFEETEGETKEEKSAVTPEIIPEKKKRKKSAAVPTSVEETEELIKRYKSEHLSEPKVDHLDVHSYAVSIFDYYMAKGDTWRDKKGTPIKMPYRAVCNWINSDLKRGCLKTMFTAVDFERAANSNVIEGDARVVNDWEANTISFED